MVKKWKLYQFAIFVAVCILLNNGGRMLAAHYEWPIWLDSFGTVFCAYLAGPVCGAIVGLTANLIYGMENHLSIVYGLTSITLGIIVGIASRKKMLDTMFGTLSVSMVTALGSIVVSVPLNILLHGGSTGNKWGDGVLMFLEEQGFPWSVSAILGQFYVDFLDKLLTLVFLHLLLRAIRWIMKKRGKGDSKPDAGAAAKAVSILLITALCCGAYPARAEGQEAAAGLDYNNYVQTVYSSKSGLPCGEANDIAQTNDGILWIGTYAGLYRYNGREFHWMDGFESVRNVNCLYVDQEGRLWIGTNDNGLSICINERITNVVDQSMGLPANSVRSIIQSADGYYYIGTTGSMQVLTLSSGLKTANTLFEVNYADDIAADSQGHVAAVTNGGRLYLMKSAHILSSLQNPDGSEIYRSCCFDEAGHLLAGTSGGNIHIFDITEGSFELVDTMHCGALVSIKDLYFLPNGELIISADNGVGYRDAAGKFRIINTNDFNNSIDNMIVDYQGNLWFTSSRLGLLRMAPSSFRDVYGSVGMRRQVVNTIVKWQNAYYIGTDKGLDIVDPSCRYRIENDLTEQFGGIRIRCMAVDSADRLWICTYGSGLFEVEPDGTQHAYNNDNGSFGNRARLVKELSDGTVLAAGDTGLCFIRDHEITRTLRYTSGKINSMILTATELSDGRILVGTDGDGIAILKDHEVEQMLTRGDGLTSEVILRSAADPKSDGVFIVTSSGLDYMDGDGKIRPLQNFPYFNNYDIWFKDADTMYVMSSAGIYVVNRDELLSGKEKISYELLDSKRGLNSALTANSWTYSEPDGSLFLPCDKGVFIFDTENYDHGSMSYRMSISAVRMDGGPSRSLRGRLIEVDRSVGKIELFPEIINYTIQDPAVGYYLEGFDNHWTMVSQSALNSIVYTNLPPGEYTLHLAVFDSSHQTVFSERIYSLVKAKAIYDEPWFTVYILIIPMIAVAWLSWFLGRVRMQHVLERQEHELELVRQQVQMGNETIIAIAKAVDAKDERTSQHSLRVSQYSVMIAQELGLSSEECENLRKAALMHDIGKIGIPDAILNKPARLTDEEYAVMKSHTTRGSEILKDFTLIDHVVEGAAYHHERYDGRGYPSGLKGENIPLYARIIGVADAFDAMTANRVYRKQMDFGYVLGEMEKGRGAQFDPQMVDILLRLIDEGKINLEELYGVKVEKPAEGGQA